MVDKRKQTQDSMREFAASLNPDPTASTMPADQLPRQEEKQPNPKPRGVYLKEEDWKIIEEIKSKTGWKVGTILTYGVRYFLKQYQEGKIPFESRMLPPKLD
jgi:hypothetical protein